MYKIHLGYRYYRYFHIQLYISLMRCRFHIFCYYIFGILLVVLYCSILGGICKDYRGLWWRGSSLHSFLLFFCIGRIGIHIFHIIHYCYLGRILIYRNSNFRNLCLLQSMLYSFLLYFHRIRIINHIFHNFRLFLALRLGYKLYNYL